MPYNPGVVDRSGQLIGAGIMSGASSLSNMLEALSMHQEKEEDKQKFQLGLKKALKPAWQELGFGSAAEYENADTKSVLGLAEGAITKSNLARMQQEQSLTAEKLQELSGNREAQGRFNSMVSDAGAPSGPLTIGALAGDSSSLAPGSMAAAGGNMRRPAISLQQMEQMAAQSNLPIGDQVHLAQIAALAGKSDPESMRNRVPEIMKLGGRDVLFSRGTGMFQLMPDMTGGSVMDEAGEPVPGLVMVNGKAVRIPGSTDAQQKKLSVEALVEGEKALRAIDDDIAAWNSRAARAARDTTIKAPDASVLKNLQQRKARLENALQPADEGGGAAPATGNFGGVGDADAIRAAFKAGKISKEEAVKRLKTMGFK